ncbi:MAG TPA: inositol monophosphatase family protein [Acidimicrobiales bacterium]|nr:inositol monophosphatase family protein [Acidimicrobiales bacterium]
MTPGVDEDLALALRLADAADEISRAGFTGAAIDHRLKADGSPVSATDVAVERRIRALVAEARPADGMLGEEVGASGPAGRRWIVDGIDGTVLFVAGRRGWATEIGLEVDGEVVVGVSTEPVTGRRWWAARGRGAWLSGPAGGPPSRLAVRAPDGAALAAAPWTVIPPLDALAGEQRRLAERLGAAAGAYVPPTEHGALFVADGRAAVCLQTGGGPWDFAALSVIVAEAGGRFSDLAGRPDIYGGGPALFSDGRVHDAVVAALTA